MKPHVTIIICTCNRADSLRETLASIGRCTVPADLPTELLVVDNASTDHTQQVVNETKLANMPVRWVHEPRRGKGYAYNTGMAEARGDVLLFTDDDVRVPKNWIEGMCRVIAEGEADAVAGGVRLAPHLERPWLKGEIRGWVGSTDILDLNRPGTVVGANMAFSAAVLNKVPKFDPELGPGALGFYDEALFWHQLIAAGFRWIGRPDVEIEHHFDHTRLTPQAFEGIARRLGRSWAYMYYHWEHGRIRYMLPRLFVYRILARVRSTVARLRDDPTAVPEFSILKRLFRLASFDGYCRMRQKGVRNYARHGLVKLNGAGSSSAASAPTSTVTRSDTSVDVLPGGTPFDSEGQPALQEAPTGKCVE